MQQPKNRSSIVLPLTNIYAKGDYTVELIIGSERQPVNLVVDTGSSTFVVSSNSYHAVNDNSLTATSYAQEVNYGIGGWAGPVVFSSISLCENEEQCHLTKGHIAIAISEKSDSFGDADGILGLAYHHLNKSFNLSDYLNQQEIIPEHTFPWPFTKEHPKTDINSTDLKGFKKFLWQHPEQDIPSYFTELVNNHLVDNKFAFYSKRSSIHMAQNSDNIELSAQDPLNQGVLVLGGGEEYKELYQGEFKEIPVKHDIYYNVVLASIQVGNNPKIEAAPLEQKHIKSYCTNAIVDTGASLIVLTAELYQQVIKRLAEHSEKFIDLLTPFTDINFQYQGIDSSLLDLSQWPDLYFIFSTESEETGSPKEVSLKCSPETYWQLNTPEYGKACFKILSQLSQWPNQSIIGLPLINNYYVVFDRSKGGTGALKFAEIRRNG